MIKLANRGKDVDKVVSELKLFNDMIEVQFYHEIPKRMRSQAMHLVNLPASSASIMSLHEAVKDHLFNDIWHNPRENAAKLQARERKPTNKFIGGCQIKHFAYDDLITYSVKNVFLIVYGTKSSITI